MITEIILPQVLAYLIALAVNLRSDEIIKRHKEKLQTALDKKDDMLFAIDSAKSLEERLEKVAGETGRLIAELPIDAELKSAFTRLLFDPDFRSDIAQWLSLWDLPQCAEAQIRITEALKSQLPKTGFGSVKAAEFTTTFFNIAESIVFADPILSRWRHQLSLNELRSEHQEIIRRLRERDGEFDASRLTEVEYRYREIALKTHDIIDLHGMPEDDRHLAMQRFVLRQLYVPLRVKTEGPAADRMAAPDVMLEIFESDREKQRLRAAGRMKDKHAESGKNVIKSERAAVGDLLQKAGRIVVLADPGGGKTTLMRWFATAYLLRLKHDPDLKQLPDITTLPDADWLPILIRCRELPHNADTCAFDDWLVAHINQLNLDEVERRALKVLFRKRLEEGTALLMIDGLDEIQEPRLRARFSRRLETLAALFENAPVLVTSRIVGYREMPFRLGNAFLHSTITDFSPDEMDEFARRWAAATEHESRREQAINDLIANIHSTERVERLAGNPMLLTTLALVHRKVGRLPQKRHELYREALKVLLNWRGDIDERLDWDEAIPQLEYVAYEMCAKGMQQIPRNRVIDLLVDMHNSYGSRIRDVNKRTPEEFLRLLERRSSLMIEAGLSRVEGSDVPVYEFRHLTFQEYLAALALVDGRFPGHDKGIRFPERLGPLAGIIDVDSGLIYKDFSTVENWREPIRLALAECNPDDVDDALLAILEPADGEDKEKTTRPRAVMAALCLADEPNVADENAKIVLERFASQVNEQDGESGHQSSLDKAALELGHSSWGKNLQIALLEFYCQNVEKNNNAASLAAIVAYVSFPTDEMNQRKYLQRLVTKIKSDEEISAIGASLEIMQLAFNKNIVLVDGLIEALIGRLEISPASCHAASWALSWLSGRHSIKKGVWEPTPQQINNILQIVDSQNIQYVVKKYLMWPLAKSRDGRVADLLIDQIKSNDALTRQETIIQLAIYDCIDNRECRLLSRYIFDDPEKLDFWVGLDPVEPIEGAHINRKAQQLNLPPHEVLAAYQRLAPRFNLNITVKKLGRSSST